MMAKDRKNANGEGSKPYKDKHGRWCVRHTFRFPEGSKRRAFYGRGPRARPWPRRTGLSPTTTTA